MFGEPSYIIEGKQATSYAAFAALTWMTWDTIIHFDVEVECIWKRPKLGLKLVYAFLRYLPILHGGAILTLAGPRAYPDSACRAWILEQFIVIEILTLTVEAVLVMRLYVLYNHSKIMLSVILVAFVAEVVVMLTILGIIVPQVAFTPDCLVKYSPRIFIGYWISSLVFETFLFILTLIKFLQHIHEMRREQSVLYVFVRDGTWAFAVLFVALLLNLMMYQLINTPVAGMGYFWALSVMSFAGSHVLLNIRRLGVPIAQDTLPTIHFAPVTDEILMTELTATESGGLTPELTLDSFPSATETPSAATQDTVSA